MICNKCNHALPDDSEFCQYCGSKIEKECSISDEVISKPSAAEEPVIDNMDLSDPLKAIFEVQVRETVKAMEANSKNQPNHEDDADFGLVPEKPIYTFAMKSVAGEEEYLNNLYTLNGEKIKWNRRGSTGVAGINGLIDVYNTYLPSGQPYKTIYINMYGAKPSTKAPCGFVLNDVEKVKKKKPKKEKKAKTKYCSRCGSIIDNNTKVCAGCGKKYFKGIRFTKFSITVVILFLALAGSIALNIVQLSENTGLANKAKSLAGEKADLEEKVSYLMRQLVEEKVEEQKNNSFESETYEKSDVRVFDSLADLEVAALRNPNDFKEPFNISIKGKIARTTTEEIFLFPSSMPLSLFKAVIGEQINGKIEYSKVVSAIAADKVTAIRIYMLDDSKNRVLSDDKVIINGIYNHSAKTITDCTYKYDLTR